MIGDSPDTDTKNGFFMNVNDQIDMVCVCVNSSKTKNIKKTAPMCCNNIDQAKQLYYKFDIFKKIPFLYNLLSNFTR